MSNVQIVTVPLDTCGVYLHFLSPKRLLKRAREARPQAVQRSLRSIFGRWKDH